MATLRALLDIYGSLDTAVLNSSDPRVAEIADQFLPGTSTNAEWYREIEAFTFPDGDEARSEADPVRALREINDDRLESDQQPTIPELSRLVYGIGAVLHLNSVVPIWEELPRRDDRGGRETRELLLDALALAGPESFESNREILEPRLDDVVEVFATQFRSWQDWSDVTAQLQAMGVLRADVASVPLCQAAVITIDGIESVVVDTEFESKTVSLNQLKAVVDPRNWHNNYPHFFCNMQYRGKRPDGWHKVLETVGLCAFPEPISGRLRTMLKFNKTTDLYEARLDYDLNDPIPDPDGDGKIIVDRGFINMWSTGKNPGAPGVVVRTKKVAHITGVRPYTQKRYVCIFGYGYATIEMLFGPAQNPDPKFVYAPWDDADGSGTASGVGASTKPAPAPPTNTVASTAIEMLAECTTDLTAKNLDLVDKWLTGKLTFAEMAKYSAEIGARIASDPWKFMQAISQPKGGGK